MRLCLGIGYKESSAPCLETNRPFINVSQFLKFYNTLCLMLPVRRSVMTGFSTTHFQWEFGIVFRPLVIIFYWPFTLLSFIVYIRAFLLFFRQVKAPRLALSLPSYTNLCFMKSLFKRRFLYYLLQKTFPFGGTTWPKV